LQVYKDKVFHVSYSFYGLSTYLLPYQSEEKLAVEKDFFMLETKATIGQILISTTPVKSEVVHLKSAASSQLHYSYFILTYLKLGFSPAYSLIICLECTLTLNLRQDITNNVYNHKWVVHRYGQWSCTWNMQTCTYLLNCVLPRNSVDIQLDKLGRQG